MASNPKKRPKRDSGRVAIYDTTLRDGAQTAGLSFSLEDKLLITKKLDDLAVDYIEGGYPLSNPKDEAFFKEVRKLKLKTARIAAFGMTCKKHIKAQDDPSIQALIASKAPVITLVGKSSDLQVKAVLAASLDENLRMISDSVRSCAKLGRHVIFDAEHFFDGYKHNPNYAFKCLIAALDSGAKCVCLCDTNGGALPPEIDQIISQVRSDLSSDVLIGFHGHNDSGLAVANTLAAIASGARHVQGTINGLGERCGNADLTTIIANMVLKTPNTCLKSHSLKKLTEVSRYVYEVANLNLQDNQPFVGTAPTRAECTCTLYAVRSTHTNTYRPRRWATPAES